MIDFREMTGSVPVSPVSPSTSSSSPTSVTPDSARPMSPLSLPQTTQREDDKYEDLEDDPLDLIVNNHHTIQIILINIPAVYVCERHCLKI